MKNKKNTKISHWINAIVLTLVPFLGTFFGVGEYTYRGASNALFISCVITLSFIAMTMIVRTGVFDVFNYSALRFFESFKPSNPKSFDSAYEYKEVKNKERIKEKPYIWPYLGFGLLTFVLALSFMLVVDQSVKTAGISAVSGYIKK